MTRSREQSGVQLLKPVRPRPENSYGLGICSGDAPVTGTASYLQLAETNLGIAVAV